MSKKILKPILASAVTIALMAGCTGTGMPTIKNDNGTTNNTQTAAVIGGLLGAVIGGTTANRDGKRVAIGGAIGAAVGAAVGYSLDQQAAEVAQTLNTNVNNNPNAEQNSNNDLIVSNTDKFVKIMFRDPMMFQTNSSTPTASAASEIRQMIPALQKPSYANMIIQTVGHTDNRGSFQHNQDLSVARASSVGNTIKSGGVTNPIYSKGCSFSKPVVQNTSASNMALNRRVEIYLYPNESTVIDPCI
ncbi:MAG: Outer membrane lipoprotein omp16 precursor [uncultured Sulfurovum sp.]|uniref:Outer membrane lipoprotein omp16 n=1 Tax=uncultured Sulfurovum sp. TaxID=269237 RepID=A0A6S6TWN2_9BACT|nr:MAG: Outer membrane lipoprotein omp16 precursor [uncultured Sulfurovum sp.]